MPGDRVFVLAERSDADRELRLSARTVLDRECADGGDDLAPCLDGGPLLVCKLPGRAEDRHHRIPHVLHDGSSLRKNCTIHLGAVTVELLRQDGGIGVLVVAMVDDLVLHLRRDRAPAADPILKAVMRFCYGAVAFGLVFSAVGSILGGIWADKFDQVAGFQNFLIMPLTMLSGVFYSIHSLPEFWQQVSHFNPFFYMIDGFRYGFFGASDVPPARSLAVVTGCCLVLSLFTLRLLARGYKLRA